MSNLREIEKLIQKEQIVKAVVGNYVIYRRDWLQDNIEQEYILQKSAAAFNKKFGIEELKRLIDQERKEAEKDGRSL